VNWLPFSSTISKFSSAGQLPKPQFLHEVRDEAWRFTTKVHR
jgi:hypothetical protein